MNNHSSVGRKLMTRGWVMSIILACLSMAAAHADKPILLVTPHGVYRADVENGVPGQWAPAPYDVVIQGFGSGGGGGTAPVPPVTPPPADPVVVQVTAITRSTLKDKSEATAVIAILDSLVANNLSGSALKDAIELTMPIADSGLNAGGRLVSWAKQSLAVTTDPGKLKAGVQAAYSVGAAELQQIAAAAETGTVPPEASVDIAKIIEIVTMILELLKKLGVV